jgi:hypothetical protein
MNSIKVAFSDQGLPSTTKASIVSDLQNCFLGWATNAEIRLVSNGEVTNYVYYGTRTPYYPENIDFPKWIVDTPSGLALQVPKKLSDAYTNAFAFAAANSNTVAAYEFAAFISSTNFYSVTSNMITDLILVRNATPEMYAASFSDITNSLRKQTYYPPSLLGFYHSTNGPSANNLYFLLPMKSNPGYGYDAWNSFPVIWHDNKWKICLGYEWVP